MLQQQWWRTGHVQKNLSTGSRRGVNGTRHRQRRLQGYPLVGVADARCLAIYLLRGARRNLYFDPPKLGDRPPTSELIPLYHSLRLLAAVAVTTYAGVAYRSPVATQ